MTTQQEGYSQDPVHQAIITVPVTSAPIQVDTTPTWATHAANNLITARPPDYEEALNKNNYVVFPDGSTYLWVRPGVYEIRLEVSVKNTHEFLDADIVMGMTGPTGLPLYYLVPGGFNVYSGRAIPGMYEPVRQLGHSFIQKFPGQWDDDAVQVAFRLATYTPGATIEVVPPTQIIFRRLGNNV
jgi:hypothetical protein